MLGNRDESIGFYASQTVKNIIRYLTFNLKPFDVTPEQWTVLRFLAEKDGITQKELAQKADKDQPTITRILDILERKKLIHKEKNEADRRSFFIFISEKGLTAINELAPFIDELYETKILKGISEKDLEVFHKVLSQINVNIR